MSEVYIPVGVVASGKTTACRNWAQKNGAVIVEADVFRTIFYHKYVFDPSTEDIIWKLMMTATADWVDHEVNVAVDDAVLFLKRKMRRDFANGLVFSTWRPFSVTWDFLPLPTDEEVYERRSQEGRGYSPEEWVDIANKQKRELERD